MNNRKRHRDTQTEKLLACLPSYGKLSRENLERCCNICNCECYGKQKKKGEGSTSPDAIKDR